MQTARRQSNHMQNTPRQLLTKLFGYKTFRPHQETIIDASLAGHDVFAVMPTGAGKSLCYQLPAVSRKGTCIVVSPLISLMKDQVDKMCRLGIKAAYLNSALTAKQQALVLENLQHQKYDLLYVAPERFGTSTFREVLPKIQPCLFAIDEAHCISEWGHDFRPDYLALSQLTKDFPKVPIAAFTATATPRAQEDIVQRLGLRNPHMVRTSFDRPNLFYQVAEKQDELHQISAFVRQHAEQIGIVYRGTRRAVEDTAEHLQAQGIKALPYHAGMDSDMRQRHQEAFDTGTCDVVVATIAFGMGIDKPNVRYVIHGDLPKNVDSYYQETGRAGRDGEPAHCLLLFDWSDVPRIRYFISKMPSPEEQRKARTKLDAMIQFATRKRCRRHALLGYFGERYHRRECRTCDICDPRSAFNAPKTTQSSHHRRPSTLSTTLRLIREGLSLQDIAQQRELESRTIARHIADLAARGDVSDISRHVASAKVRLLQELFDQHGTERLKPIVEAAAGRISYDEARIVRGALQKASC